MAVKERLYEIDVLRFFAAIAVAIFHYTFAGNALGSMDQPAFLDLSIFTRYGYLGVDLFFIISGFVITMSAERAASPQHFLTSRFIRLYPAFFVAVLLTAAARTFFGGENDDLTISTLFLNLGMLPGVFESWNDIEFVDGVYWSLMAEIKFYFLILIVLILRQQKHLQWLMLGWLAATLASDQIEFTPWLDEFLLLEWSPYFIAGAMFYQIYAKGLSAIRIISIAVCLYLSIKYATWRLYELNELYSEEFSAQYTSFIVIGLYLIFVLLVSDMLKAFRHPKLLLLGGLTYPLYLIHQEIGYILFNQTQYLEQPFVQLAIISTGIIMASAIIHILVEKRFATRIKERLLRQPDTFSQA